MTDPCDPRFTLEAHGNHVIRVRFAPDGRTLFSAGMDAAIRLWDTETWEEVDAWDDHDKSVNDLLFLKDGEQLLSAASDNTIRLWDVEDGEVLRVFEGHTKPVVDLALSADEAFLASGSYDGTIRIWDVKSGECLHTFGRTLQSAIFVPGSDVILATGRGATLYKTDRASLPQMKSALTYEGRVVILLSLQHGRLLITRTDGREAHIEIRDPASLDLFQTVRVPGPGRYPTALSADGRHLAVGWERSLSVFTVNTGMETARCRLPVKSVGTVAISPDQKWLVGGFADRRLRVWDLPTLLKGPVAEEDG